MKAAIIKEYGNLIYEDIPTPDFTNDDIFIAGTGKVGHSILHAAKSITNGKVIMTDILEKRLNMAKSAFPDIITININETDPLECVREITKGKGVDIAFEAVGHEVEVNGRHNPVRTCINSIKGGGTVCVLGLSDHPAKIVMKELIWKEAKIIASRVSHGEFSAAISALEKGLLNPESMITGILDLKDAIKAFVMLEEEPDKHLKILLRVS